MRKRSFNISDPNSLSVRVRIIKDVAGSQTVPDDPQLAGELPPLITTDSVGLWRKIRTWIDAHFLSRGQRVAWIYAELRSAELFPRCPSCKGSGHIKRPRKREPTMCPECHELKVVLPGL